MKKRHKIVLYWDPPSIGCLSGSYAVRGLESMLCVGLGLLFRVDQRWRHTCRSHVMETTALKLCTGTGPD